jgi:hypothetical protein
MPKLTSVEFRKVFDSISMYSTYVERPGENNTILTFAVQKTDLIAYVDDLEQKLIRLATKVADSL